MKDLQQMAKEVEEVMKRHLGKKQSIGMIISFTLPPDYKTVHWVSNLDRNQGAAVLQATAEKMIAKTN
jgi:predicted NBD/HSP70 family sugar kinase